MSTVQSNEIFQQKDLVDVDGSYLGIPGILFPDPFSSPGKFSQSHSAFGSWQHWSQTEGTVPWDRDSHGDSSPNIPKRRWNFQGLVNVPMAANHITQKKGDISLHLQQILVFVMWNLNPQAMDQNGTFTRPCLFFKKITS